MSLPKITRLATFALSISLTSSLVADDETDQIIEFLGSLKPELPADGPTPLT